MSQAPPSRRILGGLGQAGTGAGSPGFPAAHRSIPGWHPGVGGVCPTLLGAPQGFGASLEAGSLAGVCPLLGVPKAMDARGCGPLIPCKAVQWGAEVATGGDGAAKACRCGEHRELVVRVRLGAPQPSPGLHPPWQSPSGLWHGRCQMLRLLQPPAGPRGRGVPVICSHTKPGAGNVPGDAGDAAL